MPPTSSRAVELSNLIPSREIMAMFRGRFLRAFLVKWRKLSAELLTSAKAHDYYQCSQWLISSWNPEEQAIPKDVPKGHMVVYVGDARKRFVIRVSFLEHPLFRALLERAREEYEFNPHSKLCIPCDENSFLGILRYVRAQQATRICPCF